MDSVRVVVRRGKDEDKMAIANNSDWKIRRRCGCKMDAWEEGPLGLGRLIGRWDGVKVSSTLRKF